MLTACADTLSRNCERQRIIIISAVKLHTFKPVLRYPAFQRRGCVKKIHFHYFRPVTLVGVKIRVFVYGSEAHLVCSRGGYVKRDKNILLFVSVHYARLNQSIISSRRTFQSKHQSALHGVRRYYEVKKIALFFERLIEPDIIACVIAFAFTVLGFIENDRFHCQLAVG